MRILLYGGSFDPPHYGHLNNLRAAASRVQPDEIVGTLSLFSQMIEKAKSGVSYQVPPGSVTIPS